MTGLKYPMGTRPIQSSLSTDSSLVGSWARLLAGLSFHSRNPTTMWCTFSLLRSYGLLRSHSQSHTCKALSRDYAIFVHFCISLCPWGHASSSSSSSSSSSFSSCKRMMRQHTKRIMTWDGFPWFPNFPTVSVLVFLWLRFLFLDWLLQDGTKPSRNARGFIHQDHLQCPNNSQQGNIELFPRCKAKVLKRIQPGQQIVYMLRCSGTSNDLYIILYFSLNTNHCTNKLHQLTIFRGQFGGPMISSPGGLSHRMPWDAMGCHGHHGLFTAGAGNEGLLSGQQTQKKNLL